MLRFITSVPIWAVSLTNSCLLLFWWVVDNFVLRADYRYPAPLLLFSAALMVFLPHFCVARGEVMFRSDPGGYKSKAFFYCIAYIIFVVYLAVDVNLIGRVLSA
jgi:hypothetical protein